MSEESGKCPICGEYLDHYGRSVLCYNTKCPLYLEAGPLVALIGALVDLVQDRPTPIETAPPSTSIMIHLKNGERCKAEIRDGHVLNDMSYFHDNFIDFCDIIGWTPEEEVKP